MLRSCTRITLFTLTKFYQTRVLRLAFVLLTFIVLLHAIKRGILSEIEILTAKSNTELWYMSNPNISNVLQLRDETCTHCLEPLETCRESDPLNVIFFVTSSPEHKQQRDTIRTTWGNARSLRMKPIFVMGISSDSQLMLSVYKEAKLTGDIIVENFVDTYANLTIKTGTILKNFLRLCPSAKYLMKTDDDVFVNPNVIDELVRDITFDIEKSKLPILGMVSDKLSRPYRSPQSKYYLPFSLYAKETLPRFASGTGYLVPGNRVRRLLEASFEIGIIPLEDVYFTGIVAELAHVDRLNVQGFVTKKHGVTTRKVATLHPISPSEMEKLWSILQKSNTTCHYSCSL